MAVVPNGVDLDYFRPVDDAPQGDTAVFNGVLNYRPNLDAAFYLVEEIWPRVVEKRPNATLTIVGRGESADAVRRLRRPGVVITGEVPDVRPYLANAAVVLVPIRMGGGTRLKVVEALAMARPLVSTSLGCEGINVRDGEHLLVTDEAATFAAAIIRLFEDAQLGRALGRAGRERMEQEYSWERATAQLEQLYERVLDGAAGRRGRRTNSVAATRPA